MKAYQCGESGISEDHVTAIPITASTSAWPIHLIKDVQSILYKMS